jgi:nitroreductase
MLRETLIPGLLICDDGIASQSILLGATEAGFGGCIIHSVNRSKIHELLQLPDHLEVVQVIALGKPKEKVVLEVMKDDEVKYWRDENQVHHVPKRTLDEIIVKVPS